MRRSRRDEGGQACRRHGELGQGLVEMALCLPLLLMLLIGIVEVGRIYHYTTILASAAREGAAYASLHAADSDVAAQAERRACYETGLVAYNASPSCPAGVTVVHRPRNNAGDFVSTDPVTGAEVVTDDVVVQVTYDFNMLVEFKLLSGLFENILPRTLLLRAEARMPNLTN